METKTMSTETTNTTTVENKKETQLKDYVIKQATIIKVFPSEHDANRVVVVLNKEFLTINKETGELKNTTMFSINIRNFINLMSPHMEYLQIADIMCGKNKMNPMLFNLIITGTKCDILRKFHNDGDERENDLGEYEGDGWSSTNFANVSNNYGMTTTNFIMKLLETKPYLEPILKERLAAAIDNPFNVE